MTHNNEILHGDHRKIFTARLDPPTTPSRPWFCLR